MIHNALRSSGHHLHICFPLSGLLLLSKKEKKKEVTSKIVFHCFFLFNIIFIISPHSHLHRLVKLIPTQDIISQSIFPTLVIKISESQHHRMDHCGSSGPASPAQAKHLAQVCIQTNEISPDRETPQPL